MNILVHRLFYLSGSQLFRFLLCCPGQQDYLFMNQTILCQGIEAQEISHSAECDQGLCPMDPNAFEKAGETFFMLQHL